MKTQKSNLILASIPFKNRKDENLERKTKSSAIIDNLSKFYADLES